MTAEVLRYAAFTRDGRGGNGAGVVLDATGLTDPHMLAIAQAVGFSETAFVVPGAETDGRVRVRYFSPEAEVAFCGHATIATAVAWAERRGPGTVRLRTKAGPVRVVTRRQEGRLVATLTSPPTRRAPLRHELVETALDALRWTAADLDPRFPVHTAYAGNHHLVLGVRSRGTLASLSYDHQALAQLMERAGWISAYLFWAEDATTFHTRNPFPLGGVVEDPATGAAAAALGGYLRDLRLVPVPSRLVLHQGHDMGSPSRLLVDLSVGAASVEVSGTATPLPLSPYDDLVVP